MMDTTDRLRACGAKNAARTLAIYFALRTIRAGVWEGGMRGGGERNEWLARVPALLVALVLAGCGATRAPSPGDTAITSLMSAKDQARLAAITQQRLAQRVDPDPGYRIGPDDLLEITIPDLIDATPYRRATTSPTLSPAVPSVEAAPVFRQGVRVSAMGDITIPQLGIIPAANSTAHGLETDIASRLRAAAILNEPEVTVTIVEHRSRVVAVVGSVQRPGLFPLTRPHATISDMIWASGGPSKEAGRIVQFTPATDPGARAVDGWAADAPEAVAPIRIDLEMLLRPGEPGLYDLNAPVRPGDVISVAPAGVVSVDGWVQKPGSYPVSRNLTLTATIAAAGGSSFPADRTRVTVKRALNATEEHFMTVDLQAVDERLAPDLPIIDGDVVYLPASGPRLVPWGIWQFFATIFRVGASVVAF
jgi:polysaccharide export outer membrane protein